MVVLFSFDKWSKTSCSKAHGNIGGSYPVCCCNTAVHVAQHSNRAMRPYDRTMYQCVTQLQCAVSHMFLCGMIPRDKLLARKMKEQNEWKKKRLCFFSTNFLMGSLFLSFSVCTDRLRTRFFLPCYLWLCVSLKGELQIECQERNGIVWARFGLGRVFGVKITFSRIKQIPRSFFPSSWNVYAHMHKGKKTISIILFVFFLSLIALGGIVCVCVFFRSFTLKKRIIYIVK